MSGLNRFTGQEIGGNDHIAQSIGDILTTPIGTRIGRRDYGSMLFDLIDAPGNAATARLLVAASATAIARHEPRIILTRVALEGDPATGSFGVRVEGKRADLPANAHVTLSIPISARPRAN